MILDNVQITTAEEKIKQNESLSANSIKYKKESLAATEAKVKELIKDLEEDVAVSVSEGNDDVEIRKNYIGDAEYISRLLEEVDVLKTMQGPVELVESRAIRLIDKMIRAAKDNSKRIYNELEIKSNDELEIVPNDDESEKSDEELNPITINVQEIAKENESSANDEIEQAINEEEESLKDEDIKEVFDESLGVNDKEKEVTFDAEEIKRKINEALAASFEKESFEESENEYVPMTDEEIEKSREKIEEPKEFEIEIGENDIVIDNTVVTPEREEVPEFTTAKEIVASGELKEKLKDDFKEKYKGLSYEEIKEKLSAQNNRNAELKIELSNAEKEQEEALKINSEVIVEEENIEKAEAETAEEEANIEKKNAELKAQEEQEAQKLYDLALENLIATEKENEELATTIGGVNEKSATVKENTEARRENITNKKRSMETRRENITNINRDNEQLQESIESKRREMEMMLGESSESEDDYGKTK